MGDAPDAPTRAERRLLASFHAIHFQRSSQTADAQADALRRSVQYRAALEDCLSDMTGDPEGAGSTAAVEALDFTVSIWHACELLMLSDSEALASDVADWLVDHAIGPSSIHPDALTPDLADRLLRGPEPPNASARDYADALLGCALRGDIATLGDLLLAHPAYLEASEGRSAAAGASEAAAMLPRVLSTCPFADAAAAGPGLTHAVSRWRRAVESMLQPRQPLDPLCSAIAPLRPLLRLLCGDGAAAGELCGGSWAMEACAKLRFRLFSSGRAEVRSELEALLSLSGAPVASSADFKRVALLAAARLDAPQAIVWLRKMEEDSVAAQCAALHLALLLRGSRLLGADDRGADALLSALSRRLDWRRALDYLSERSDGGRGPSRALLEAARASDEAEERELCAAARRSGMEDVRAARCAAAAGAHAAAGRTAAAAHWLVEGRLWAALAVLCDGIVREAAAALERALNAPAIEARGVGAVVSRLRGVLEAVEEGGEAAEVCEEMRMLAAYADLSAAVDAAAGDGGAAAVAAATEGVLGMLSSAPRRFRGHLLRVLRRLLDAGGEGARYDAPSASLFGAIGALEQLRTSILGAELLGMDAATADATAKQLLAAAARSLTKEAAEAAELRRQQRRGAVGGAGGDSTALQLGLAPLLSALK